MRIRRCASRLLGYAISSAPPDSATRFEQQLPLPPPPPPPPRPCPSGTESLGGGGGSAHFTASGQPPCELSLSPWDLMVQLGLSDPQEQEEFEETYMVFISFRASWAIPANLPAASLKKEQEEEIAVATVDGVRVEPREKQVAKNKAAKKAVVKEKENNGGELKKKKATVKADEGEAAAGEAQLIWTCRKNDGKRWSCHRLVSQPKSLCVYHSDQKRTWCNSLLSDSESMSIAAPLPVSKPPTSSKPRRKRSVVDVGEGFYYYAGFGPSRSKRQCKISSSMQQQQESPPPAQHNEAPEDHVTAATTGQAQADDSADHQSATPCCDDDMARIAGGDEESSDGEPRVVSVNGDSKRKSPLKKRWRKPVKARSLKSLM